MKQRPRLIHVPCDLPCCHQDAAVLLTIGGPYDPTPRTMSLCDRHLYDFRHQFVEQARAGVMWATLSALPVYHGQPGHGVAVGGCA